MTNRPNGPARNTIGDTPAPSGAPAGAESSRDRSYATREVTLRARSPRGFLIRVTLRDVTLETVEATETRLLGAGYRPED